MGRRRMLGVTKTPLPNQEVGQQGFEGLLWGPNDLWARPIYPGKIQRPKPRRASAQARQSSLWVPPRVVQSSADPRYPQREGRKRYRAETWGKRSKNIQGKLSLLPFSSLNLTEPHSLTFINTLNDFEYRLMGQISTLEMLTLYVDEGR